MNTYWAEQHARQHIDQMAADAQGDALLKAATDVAAIRPDVPGPRLFWRARARVQALALRRLRFAARPR